MTGRPQRENPKQTSRLCICEDTYQAILPLMKTSVHEFASLSQLIETIIFLSEHIYIAESEDEFAIGLAKLRLRRTVNQIKVRGLLATRFIHVTLDEKAIAFLGLLVEKYPMLFRTRSDATELLLLDIASACTTEKAVRYYANRLLDVLEMHPTHASLLKRP